MPLDAAHGRTYLEEKQPSDAAGDPMFDGPDRLARLIDVTVGQGPDGLLHATAPALPGLDVSAPDEAGLTSALPLAIRDALIEEEPCVALPVGRLDGPAGTWVAIPDDLAMAALAA